jgi:hypothetical protein
MKLTQILFVPALVTAMTLASNSAMALPGAIAVSAVVRTQSANAAAGNSEVSRTGVMVWNTPKVYSLITSAVANVGTNGTGLASTNLPSDGYIAFNPNGIIGGVAGTFYVTNRSGFSYPLSGVDTNGNYYSFIELDTYLGTTDNTSTNSTNSTPGLLNLGFSDNFNGIETGGYNTINGGGSESVMSTALFYVHDNPYAFNGGNNPNAFYGNANAFEIQGIADISISYKSSAVLHWSISLSGTGNAVVANSQNAIVISGHFSAAQ